MPIEEILIGDTLEHAHNVLGEELTSSSVNGFEILSFDSYTDTFASYVYLKDGKVILISQSKAKDISATIDTVFPQLELPQQSYTFDPNIRKVVKSSYTLQIWTDKGTAVVIEGNSSSNQLLRVLRFQPGDEQNLRSVWLQSKFIGQPTSYLSLAQKDQFVEIPAPTSELTSTPSSSPSYQSPIVIGAFIFALLCIVIGIFLLKKRKRNHQLPSAQQLPPG